MKYSNIYRYIIEPSVLYSITISVLILHSLLPSPGLIATASLIVSLIFIYIINNTIVIFKKNSKTFFYTYSLLLIYLVNLISSHWNKFHNIDIISFAARPSLIILLIILFLNLNTKSIYQIEKLYIILVVAMSLTGIIAWILINFNITEIGEFSFSLTEATGGKFRRDKNVAFGYDFPYSLGLVLTGSSAYELGSYMIYRASGWAHEPTTATLFIFPALIMLFEKNKYFNNYTRINCIILIFVFWIMCFSVTSIFAAIILITSICFFKLAIKRLTKNVFYIFFIVVIISLFILAYSNIIRTKILHTTTPISQLLVVISDTLSMQLWGINMYVFILFACMLSFFTFNRGTTATLRGYIVLYLIIHGGKGFMFHIMNYPFTYFIILSLIHYSFRANNTQVMGVPLKSKNTKIL
jgi:hypothetical protein